MRWIKRTCIGTGVFFLVAFFVLAWTTWRSLPIHEGTVILAGPEAAITVVRDKHGVPFISAVSEADAYFALGYVHAQDRLFQMEFMRRLGAGRLAEVLGSQGLASDKFMRTLGLYRHAKENLKVLDAQTIGILERYADGVNAWLETRSQLLPPEFQLLQYEPEPWKPADSLVWQKLMSLSLAGNWRDELLRVELLQSLSPHRVDELWPDAGPNELSTANTGDIPLQVAKALGSAIDAYAPPTLASNVWALDGQHTATGKPLLASDPHLGFQAPIVWYLAHLAWPGEVRVGATTPGVPLFVIGHNGHLAWGITTTHADLQDLFIERVIDDGRYLTPTGPAVFVERTEVIDVRFRDPVTLPVRLTRHGPVVSDLAGINHAGAESDTVLALSATMLRDDERTASGMERLSRARSVEEARAALTLFEGPQQNFVYADVNGGIGYTAAAKVPMRRAGNGTVPVPGESGVYDWLGWIPYDELPHSLRPNSGRLVNANNRPVPQAYPHLIAASFPEGYRAQRINERLDELTEDQATVEDMHAIQMDSRSSMAHDLLPRLLTLATPTTEDGKHALDLLSDWDGTMDRSRPEPLIFLTWLEEIKSELLADELGPLYRSFRGGRIRLIKSILTRNRHWCDNVTSLTAENCAHAVSMALENAVIWLADRPETESTALSSWRWGQFHKARFAHPLFGLIPGLSSLTSITIETDGGDHTVNRGGFRSVRGRTPFRHGHGAGLRAVFDLDNLDRSQYVIAVGQSGHPASSQYSDLTAVWRDGGMFNMPVSGPDVASHTLILEPLPKIP